MTGSRNVRPQGERDRREGSKRVSPIKYMSTFVPMGCAGQRCKCETQ